MKLAFICVLFVALYGIYWFWEKSMNFLDGRERKIREKKLAKLKKLQEDLNKDQEAARIELQIFEKRDE